MQYAYKTTAIQPEEELPSFGLEEERRELALAIYFCFVSLLK